MGTPPASPCWTPVDGKPVFYLPLVSFLREFGHESTSHHDKPTAQKVLHSLSLMPMLCWDGRECDHGPPGSVAAPLAGKIEANVRAPAFKGPFFPKQSHGLARPAWAAMMLARTA
ncbi:hypothetical protein E4U32_002023 [Claviceps aff. humidiphila group G2b]|nr:hypothetical protein E4U32_002023 [Claviceps aff. humidiphila group G2b]